MKTVGIHGKGRFVTLAALGVGMSLAYGPASGQEVKPATLWGDMTAVSQDMLDRAGSDASNWLHTKELRATRYTRHPDQHVDVRSSAGFRLPTGGGVQETRRRGQTASLRTTSSATCTP